MWLNNSLRWNLLLPFAGRFVKWARIKLKMFFYQVHKRTIQPKVIYVWKCTAKKVSGFGIFFWFVFFCILIVGRTDQKHSKYGHLLRSDAVECLRQIISTTERTLYIPQSFVATIALEFRKYNFKILDQFIMPWMKIDVISIIFER